MRDSAERAVPAQTWMGRRVLVTGAGGFIGSHLTLRLVEEGAEVTAFVRYNSNGSAGHLDSLPADVRSRIRVIAGDIREQSSVRQALMGMDTVFHLAALISIPYSYVDPEAVANTNIMGTLNVLIAARDAGTGCVVHTSTSEVYGTALYVPIDEDHPLQGQSPYSASKIGADKLAESFHRAFGLPVVTVRPFNTYGPRQSTRAVIPTVITQALTGECVRLGSLAPVRDFTFVEDTARGFLAAAASPRCQGEVVNLGTGTGVTVQEMVELVFDITGKRLPVIEETKRIRPEKSEVMQLICDNRRARRLAGWTPRVELEQGLRQTVEWFCNHQPLTHRARTYAI